jgi:acetyl-CoA synthetase
MNLWKESIKNPDDFWLKITKDLIYWKKEPTIGFEWLDAEAIKFSWFRDGITNMAYNCLDKHVEAGNGDQVALIWQGDL